MSKTAATVQTVTDPVCGMSVDPDHAAGSFTHNGVTYYFCSNHCRQKFQDDPHRYAAAAADQIAPATPAKDEKQPASSKSGEYTCPMHPEVRQNGPGSCPKCGMALEPVTVTPPKEKIEYTCPMHPQIVRDAPGFCPICGMALEPRTVAGEEENAELVDMRRRFWLSVVLTLPLIVLAMSEFIP
ncbi:MAG TPA: heavy metal-binding domain-containing protein, partial [Pyrinomonadaceae bacterium]|nr:heavy metal-binding domain-containing protein [Pyrinomonadaceae bacterium]